MNKTGTPNAAAPRRRRERAGARAGSWVRKNMMVDQRKLDSVRRLLGAATETEAVDMALDFVAFRREVMTGISALRRAGGIQDRFELE